MEKLSLVLGILLSANTLLLAQRSVTKLDQAPPHTKIAVVNVKRVFDEYERAKAFKAEREKLLEPYRKKANKLTDQIKTWSEHMQKVCKPGDVHYENAIIKSQRELDDLEAEVKLFFGKKQEDNLVLLWKDVNQCIKGCAEAYGFQLVLGYGTPDIVGDFDSRSIKRSRDQSMLDIGFVVPLYTHGSIDLTDAIISVLNSRRPIQPPMPKQNATCP